MNNITILTAILSLALCVSAHAQMNIRVRGNGISIRNVNGNGKSGENSNADQTGRTQVYQLPQRTAWEAGRYMIPGKYHVFSQRPPQIVGKDYATTYIASGYDKEDARTDYLLDAFKADQAGTVTIAVPTDQMKVEGWKKSPTSFGTTIKDFTLYDYDYKNAGEWVNIPSPDPKVPTLLFAEKGHIKFDNPLPISALAEGVVIAPAVTYYITDPDLIIMPNGDYIAGANGGPKVGDVDIKLWKSTDKGKTWAALNTEEIFVRHQTLFHHEGALYLFGDIRDDENANGMGAIQKSTDGGVTWPESVKLNFRFRTAPSHVIVANGRAWIATESKGGSSVFSAPLDADWMNADSWTLAPRTDDLYTNNESDLVATRGGGYPVVMPKHQHKNLVLGPTEVLPDMNSLFLPGNGSKYSAIYDPISDKYWALTSWSPLPNAIRTGIALYSSTDLKNFQFERQVMLGKSSSFHGFNYPFMQIDGDDVVFVSRTAWENEDGQPQRWHDANMFTFHRVRNFRQNTPTAGAMAALSANMNEKG